MQRRDFLKSTVAVAVAAELGMGKAQAKVPAHNWGNYDYGSGPRVTDRLNQGPFPQYPPTAIIPTDDVVMTTTPSDDVVPNYGKGLVTYITADSGTDEIKSDNIPQAIEDLVKFPLGQQLYVRPTWREVQPRPGRLEMPDYPSAGLACVCSDPRDAGIPCTAGALGGTQCAGEIRMLRIHTTNVFYVEKSLTRGRYG